MPIFCHVDNIWLSYLLYVYDNCMSCASMLVSYEALPFADRWQAQLHIWLIFLLRLCLVTQLLQTQFVVVFDVCCCVTSECRYSILFRRKNIIFQYTSTQYFRYIVNMHHDDDNRSTRYHSDYALVLCVTSCLALMLIKRTHQCHSFSQTIVIMCMDLSITQ
jgi:hypothetical protein